MLIGIVKWFNNAKGYGFICTQDENEDIFAHFSSIYMEGYKTLKAGQKVKFELNRGPKGLHALNIRPHDENCGQDSTKFNKCETSCAGANGEFATANFEAGDKKIHGEFATKAHKKEVDLFAETD